MRSVNVYKGEEIDWKKISKIKEIASKRLAKDIYYTGFSDIEDIDYLAYLHDIDVEDEILVLGNDWFLCYTITDNTVTFIEWVAEYNKDSKFAQSIEMMNTLKKIIMDNKDKEFIADMRHDSSYQFYLKMLEKNYFKEDTHSLDIDICNGFAPIAVINMKDNNSLIKKFLKSRKVRKHPEYLKYIIHCLTFSVTDKFIEQNKRIIKKK